MQSATEAQGARRERRRLTLTVGALGVVYGDIGTSPLYALRQAFSGSGAAAVDQPNVLGVCSLVVWSLLIVVTVKYLALVLRADQAGEGGILSLLSLIDPRRLGPAAAPVIATVGVFGTALLYGDGTITPAISVLSAVEGFEVAAPGVAAYTDEAAVVILVGLFAVQRFGTARIAHVFGPIMVLWFVTIALLGLRWIVTTPAVVQAVSPTYAVDFLVTGGSRAFLTLGAVFLAVTGAEALYADLGHFGRGPIRRGWYGLALPSLALAYLGQGAALLDDPARISNPFFTMAPSAAVIPLAVLATVATVIASQALISGVFSLTAQAVHLGYAPTLRIRHTSAETRGQIYVPVVNWALLVLCVGLVLGFRSSDRLAAAYGVAVVSTMAITTVLLFVVVRQRWRWSTPRALAVCVPLLLVDLTFAAANVPKIPHGGWLPLAVALVVFTLLTSWRRGRELAQAAVQNQAQPVSRLMRQLRSAPLPRVPGSVVYLHRHPEATPQALTVNLRTNHVLHTTVLLLTVVPERAPRVPDADALEMVDLGLGVWQVTVHSGFAQRLDVPARLAPLSNTIPGFDVSSATFYLGSERILATAKPGMARWRERLFAAMSRTTTDMATYFHLPVDRVVEVGQRVEI